MSLLVIYECEKITGHPQCRIKCCLDHLDRASEHHEHDGLVGLVWGQAAKRTGTKRERPERRLLSVRKKFLNLDSRNGDWRGNLKG